MAPTTAFQTAITYSAVSELTGVQKSDFMLPQSQWAFKNAVVSMIDCVALSPKYVNITDVVEIQRQMRYRQQLSASATLQIVWKITIILEETPFAGVSALTAGIASSVVAAERDNTLLNQLQANSPVFANASATVVLSPDVTVVEQHTPRPSSSPSSAPTKIFDNIHLRYASEELPFTSVGTVVLGAILVLVFLPLSLCVRDYWRGKKDKAMLKQLHNSRIEKKRYNIEEQRRQLVYAEEQSVREEAFKRCNMALLVALKTEKILRDKLQDGIGVIDAAEVGKLNSKMEVLTIEKKLLRIEIKRIEEDLAITRHNFHAGKPTHRFLEREAAPVIPVPVDEPEQSEQSPAIGGILAAELAAADPPEGRLALPVGQSPDPIQHEQYVPNHPVEIVETAGHQHVQLVCTPELVVQPKDRKAVPVSDSLVESNGRKDVAVKRLFGRNSMTPEGSLNGSDDGIESHLEFILSGLKIGSATDDIAALPCPPCDFETVFPSEVVVPTLVSSRARSQGKPVRIQTSSLMRALKQLEDQRLEQANVNRTQATTEDAPG